MLGKRSFKSVNSDEEGEGGDGFEREMEKNWKNSRPKNLLVSRNSDGVKVSSLKLGQDNTNRLTNFYNQINNLIYKVNYL